jgi:hypothetical protein
LGTITLKQVDESTNRVFTFVNNDDKNRAQFFDLVDTAAFGLKRRMAFDLSIPANLNTGRIRASSQIVMPLLNATTGIIEYGTANLSYLIPATWDLDDRKELWVLNKYLNVNAVVDSMLKDLVKPS